MRQGAFTSSKAHWRCMKSSLRNFLLPPAFLSSPRIMRRVHSRAPKDQRNHVAAASAIKRRILDSKGGACRPESPDSCPLRLRSSSSSGALVGSKFPMKRRGASGCTMASWRPFHARTDFPALV